VREYLNRGPRGFTGMKAGEFIGCTAQCLAAAISEGGDSMAKELTA